MKLAVLGAGGRTGQEVVRRALEAGHEVVALVRRPGQLQGHERLQVRRGDALQLADVESLVRGCDAVVSTLGPSSSSETGFSSRSARVLIAAMKAAGVRRVSVVTGAMSGEREHLGAFYRWATSARSLGPLLKDRREQEALLRASGLTVTIARPPRLTNRPASAEPPEVGSAMTIRMTDSCSRADLARVLLDATMGHHAFVDTVYVRSRPDASTFLRSWLLRCGAAELIGIGLAALAATRLMAFGESDGLGDRLLAYACFLVVGGVEGALIGWAQASLLVRLLPKLRVHYFVGWTVLVAVGAWALGMAPSTFFVSLQGPGNAPSAEPSLGVILGLSAAGGAFGGLLIGGAQALELGRHLPSVRPWIFSTVVGWALALPLDILGASLPSAATPSLLVIASGAGFGLLAGLTFAVPTGLAAWKYRPPTSS